MDNWKQRRTKKIWKRLAAEGIEQPKDAEENRRRAQEAHLNLDVINVPDTDRSEQYRKRRAEERK